MKAHVVSNALTVGALLISLLDPRQSIEGRRHPGDYPGRRRRR